MPSIVIALVGWAGVVFYVSAYLLLSIGILKATSYTFHSLNILGAIGLIIDAWDHQDLPNLVVNGIWLTIGIMSVLFRFYKNRAA